MSVIISVFVPDGVILGTLAIKRFNEVYNQDDSVIYRECTIGDYSHSIQLFSQYGFVYYGDTLVDNTSFAQYIDEFQQRYLDDQPSIEMIPDLLLSFFSSIESSVLSYLAGYKIRPDGKYEQFVYLVSFADRDYRRINVGNNLEPIFYFHTCGQSQAVERLLGNIMVKQGENWAEQPMPLIYFQNFSLGKSKDFVEFILRSCVFLNHINSSQPINSIPVELFVISRNNIKYIANQ